MRNIKLGGTDYNTPNTYSPQSLKVQAESVPLTVIVNYHDLFPKTLFQAVTIQTKHYYYYTVYHNIFTR